MSSREQILQAVFSNQPEKIAQPEFHPFSLPNENALDKFVASAKGIGSTVHFLNGMDDIKKMIGEKFPIGRIISPLAELYEIADIYFAGVDGHTLEDVELGVFKAHFAVAENSAMWVTEEILGKRVSPFICQHLILIVNQSDIIQNMHQAYERIGADDYGFGTFIAGPSKTADIEQSLVLGAHGPRSLDIVILS
jgi:L-lactate dehydrogenase complex protein LldG